MKKFQIIFDFDGVILNSHKIKTIGFYEIFKVYGETKAIRAQKYHIKNIGVSRFKKFKFIIKNILKDKTITLDFLNKKFNDYCIKKIKTLKLSKDLSNFFLIYHDKYDLFISTATPEMDIKHILKEKKIYKYFKKVYGSPTTKINHIKMIKKKNQKIIFIGDSLEDYKASLVTKTFFVLKQHNENKNHFKNIAVPKLNNFKNFNYKIQNLFSSI